MMQRISIVESLIDYEEIYLEPINDEDGFISLHITISPEYKLKIIWDLIYKYDEAAYAHDIVASPDDDGKFNNQLIFFLMSFFFQN